MTTSKEARPTGWKWVKLGNVCRLRTGGTPSKSVSTNFGGDIKWLVSGDIHRGEITDCEGRITQKGMESSNASILPPDSVLIALNGQGKTRGTVALLCIEATCNQSLVAMIPYDKNVLLPRFLLYQLQMRYQELRNLTGDNHRSGLSMGILNQLNLILAPIEEQKRIVKLLNQQLATVEKARQAAQQQLQAAKSLPNAYLREVFESNEAKKWEKKKLKDISTINPRRSILNVNDTQDVAFVPMPAVDASLGRITSLEYKKYSDVKKGYTYFEENDVLFAKITPCMQNGKHAIAQNLRNGFGFGTTEFHVIRPSEQVLSEWIHGFLRQRHILNEAMSHFTGAVGQQRVPPDFLENISVPLPAICRQRQIIKIFYEKIELVEIIREGLENQLQMIQCMPTSFLQKAFMGEL